MIVTIGLQMWIIPQVSFRLPTWVHSNTHICLTLLPPASMAHYHNFELSEEQKLFSSLRIWGQIFPHDTLLMVIWRDRQEVCRWIRNLFQIRYGVHHMEKENRTQTLEVMLREDIQNLVPSWTLYLRKEQLMMTSTFLTANYFLSIYYYIMGFFYSQKLLFWLDILKYIITLFWNI